MKSHLFACRILAPDQLFVGDSERYWHPGCGDCNLAVDGTLSMASAHKIGQVKHDQRSQGGEITTLWVVSLETYKLLLLLDLAFSPNIPHE